MVETLFGASLGVQLTTNGFGDLDPQGLVCIQDLFHADMLVICHWGFSHTFEDFLCPSIHDCKIHCWRLKPAAGKLGEGGVLP